MMKTRYGEAFDWVDMASIAATVVALDGVRRGLDTPVGLTETTAGTIFDAFDGQLARRFGKETEFGAGLDAGLDKIRNTAIVVAEWRQDLAPKAALGLTAVSNLISASATTVAIKHSGGHNLAVAKEGKLGAAAQNFAAGAYPLSKMLERSHPKAARTVRFLGHAATVAGAVLQTRAATHYIRRNSVLAQRAGNRVKQSFSHHHEAQKSI
jgi:phosphatidylglycerophosphate synthase